MKYLIFLSFISCGVGFNSGTGKYTGKLVDVSWEGILWKSCEIRQQTGTGTEHDDKCSSLDKSLCSKLETLMGKVITITYGKQNLKGLSIRSNCLIQKIEEVQ